MTDCTHLRHQIKTRRQTKRFLRTKITFTHTVGVCRCIGGGVKIELRRFNIHRPTDTKSV